jgi:hypothetical protein
MGLNQNQLHLAGQQIHKTIDYRLTIMLKTNQKLERSSLFSRSATEPLARIFFDFYPGIRPPSSK